MGVEYKESDSCRKGFEQVECTAIRLIVSRSLLVSVKILNASAKRSGGREKKMKIVHKAMRSEFLNLLYKYQNERFQVCKFRAYCCDVLHRRDIRGVRYGTIIS